MPPEFATTRQEWQNQLDAKAMKMEVEKGEKLSREEHLALQQTIPKPRGCFNIWWKTRDLIAALEYEQGRQYSDGVRVNLFIYKRFGGEVFCRMVASDTKDDNSSSTIVELAMNLAAGVVDSPKTKLEPMAAVVIPRMQPEILGAKSFIGVLVRLSAIGSHQKPNHNIWRNEKELRQYLESPAGVRLPKEEIMKGFLLRFSTPEPGQGNWPPEYHEQVDKEVEAAAKEPMAF